MEPRYGDLVTEDRRTFSVIVAKGDLSPRMTKPAEKPLRDWLRDYVAWAGFTPSVWLKRDGGVKRILKGDGV